MMTNFITAPTLPVLVALARNERDGERIMGYEMNSVGSCCPGEENEIMAVARAKKAHESNSMEYLPLKRYNIKLVENVFTVLQQNKLTHPPLCNCLRNVCDVAGYNKHE